LSSADLSRAYLRNTNLSNVNLSGADLSSTDLSRANLSSADLRSADLRSADLRSAILLTTDLRDYKYLIDKQFTSDDGPLLCNVALPSNITHIDPNRDCDRLPKVLSDRYNISLEEAQRLVDEARQKKRI
ncbi:MAG: pentapeptide repeat-containing protein, partial [Elainellaceae cyanobacterium]